MRHLAALGAELFFFFSNCCLYRGSGQPSGNCYCSVLQTWPEGIPSRHNRLVKFPWWFNSWCFWDIKLGRELLSISCISSLSFSVTNVFALNCSCVVTLSVRSIKFDSVSPNCSANKHAQSNCNDKIKWTTYSTWVKVESEESELCRSNPESSCSYVVWVSELQISKYYPKVKLMFSWLLLGNKLLDLQKHASAISDWY